MQAKPRFSLLTDIWRFISSVRLALVLIVIIVLLSIASIFLKQAPSGFTYGSSNYHAWLDVVVRPEYGAWTDMLGTFGLVDVFHSPLFLTAGILLILNILCCTINRFRTIIGSLRLQPKAATTDLGNTLSNYITSSAVDKTVLAVTNILLQHKYRIGKKEGAEGVRISASRFAFSRLGTLVSHLSLILLVIGFLVSSFQGYRDDNFVVAEGTKGAVGNNTNLSIGLVSFTADYWADGTPREYRSDVIVYDNGQQVKQASIMVNHPLSYHGVRFYQAFFGPAAVMQVKDAENSTIAGAAVSLVGIMNADPYQRPLGKLDLPGTGFTAYLVGPAFNISDPVLKESQLGIELYEDGANAPLDWAIIDVGTSEEIHGMSFSYMSQVSYSGFSVKYDPGAWLVWLALSLFFIGITVVLYLPYRRLSVMVKPDGTGSAVYFGLTGRRGFNTSQEIQRLTGELAATLPGQPGNLTAEGEGNG